MTLRGIAMLGEKTSVLNFYANPRIFRGSASTLYASMHTPKGYSRF